MYVIYGFWLGLLWNVPNGFQDNLAETEKYGRGILLYTVNFVSGNVGIMYMNQWSETQAQKKI